MIQVKKPGVPAICLLGAVLAVAACGDNDGGGGDAGVDAVNLCGNGNVDRSTGEECDPPNGVSCGPTCRHVGEAGRCSDGADNDDDGLIDCADRADCAMETACAEVGQCGDGRDNDADGATDCRDGQCAADPVCVEAGRCGDTVDNDADGLADCADPECAGYIACPQALACVEATAATAATPNAGNTATGTNLFEGSCTGRVAGEVVYTYTPPAIGPGTLHLTLQSSTDHGLYVRSSCTDAASELGCVDAVAGGADEHLFLPVTGGVPLAIFVDADGPAAVGPFTLDVVFTPSVCGNGIVEPGEDCDPPGTATCDPACDFRPEAACGNGLDDDGDGDIDCDDADCIVDTTACPIMATCTAATAAMPTQTGDTTGGTTAFQGSCGGAGAAEDVYTFTPGAGGESGTLTLTVTPTGASPAPLAVYVRSDCDAAASELGCAPPPLPPPGPAVLAVPVTGGAPVTIFVDGAPGAAGAYTLAVAYAAALCGNGRVEGAEQCDPPDGATCANGCRFLPESGGQCGDLLDNDGDGTRDCEAGSACAGTAACTPGTGAVGTPCDAPGDCGATGGDPLCLGEVGAGYPSGACSEWCRLAAPECDGDAVCLDVAPGAPGYGVCFDRCLAAADCRSGYLCAFDPASGFRLCRPHCVDDSQCPTTGSCDPATNLCVTP